jgi:hypothetical protein
VQPPRVSTPRVLALIRELAVGERLPSGAAVRAALQERFGSRGGVSRIYRLLADERARRVPAPLAGSAELLQEELAQLRDKLGLAHAREDLHQTRWAEELDRLRMKVAELEPLPRQLRIAQDSNDYLRHQLKAALQRAARLEQQLIERTHAATPDERRAGD